MSREKNGKKSVGGVCLYNDLCLVVSCKSIGGKLNKGCMRVGKELFERGFARKNRIELRIMSTLSINLYNNQYSDYYFTTCGCAVKNLH